MSTITVHSGSALIARERERQVTKEGWTPEHDDAHDRRELASAAYCYIKLGGGSSTEPPTAVPWEWPFEDEAWKPSKAAVRNLVKAGALIAAEIDRLNRATDKEKP